jgi:hypothetical protein
MLKLIAGLIASAAIPGLAGCTTSDALQHEGVTSYAGNAIAANTVMQMVDPWQYGVQDTDLETPAERPWRQQAGEASGEYADDASSEAKP